MRSCLRILGILLVVSFSAFGSNAYSQTKSSKKGENVNWVKVNELLLYNPMFMQELCCDCGPKTIADLFVGTTAIDALIQNACSIATRDMDLTKKIEFIKVNVSEEGADGIRTVNITDGDGKKITALSASKRLLEISSQALIIASEAQALIDKKDAAQKEVEDASYFKKASLTRGMGRGIDILKTVISETSKQTEKIKKQVEALNMLKDY
jgi:hypothetical protein